MKKTLIILSFLWSISNINAQAFDGYGDVKWIFGASVQSNGAVGLDFINDRGINDYFSWGWSAGYILTETPNVKVLEDVYDENGDGQITEDEKYYNEYKADFFENFYFSYRLNGHLSEVLNMGENADVYLGINLGRNFGAQAGARYMIGESFGFNAEATLPIKANLINLREEGQPNVSESFEKIFFRAGVIINFD